MGAPPKEYLIRETVRDGEPALGVDTEEEFASALGSGVYVVPPSWADATLGRKDSIHAACSVRILRFAPDAPEAVATEALVLYAACIYQSGAQSRQVFPTDGEGPPVNVSPAFLLSGAVTRSTSSGPIRSAGSKAAGGVALRHLRRRRSALHLPHRARGAIVTRWETRVSGEVLHLRWLVDHARPWAGVSPLQHAADTGSLSSWIERRLAEEASAPVGSFLPVARYDADPDQ